MNTAAKSILFAITAVLAVSAAPTWADGGHGHGKHGWKHHQGHFDRGYRPYYRDNVVVIREPHYVYSEPRYVYREPAYVYAPRRPALVIGVDIPPLVVPF